MSNGRTSVFLGFPSFLCVSFSLGFLVWQLCDDQPRSLSGLQISPKAQLYKQYQKEMRERAAKAVCSIFTGHPSPLGVLFAPPICFLLLFFIKCFYLLCLVWMEPGTALSFWPGSLTVNANPFWPPSSFFPPPLMCFLAFSSPSSVYEAQRAFLMAPVLF